MLASRRSFVTFPPNFVLCASRRCLASTSATAPAPPLLLKLRSDLKMAMQNKDKNRLSVLRGLIADVTNSTKNSNPITTDMHVLALLRKRAAAGKQAAEELGKGGRQDLQDNENAQISVLEEYAAGVETVSEEEIQLRVGEVINEASINQESGGKVNRGIVMKKLLGPGGTFEGKAVERATVARMVEEAIGR